MNSEILFELQYILNVEGTMKDIDEQIEKSHRKYYGKRYYYKGGSAVYGLGMIGALVYYLQYAGSFWVGVLGILKAIVWPAFVIYDLLKFLHA